MKVELINAWYGSPRLGGHPDFIDALLAVTIDGQRRKCEVTLRRTNDGAWMIHWADAEGARALGTIGPDLRRKIEKVVYRDGMSEWRGRYQQVAREYGRSM